MKKDPGYDYVSLKVRHKGKVREASIQYGPPYGDVMTNVRKLEIILEDFKNSILREYK